MVTFLRDYIGGLEAPIAVQAGTFCLSLAKTLIQTSNIGQRKRLAPGIFEYVVGTLEHNCWMLIGYMQSARCHDEKDSVNERLDRPTLSERRSGELGWLREPDHI